MSLIKLAAASLATASGAVITVNQVATAQHGGNVKPANVICGVLLSMSPLLLINKSDSFEVRDDVAYLDT